MLSEHSDEMMMFVIVYSHVGRRYGTYAARNSQ